MKYKRNRKISRLSNELSDSLMIDPERDIKLGIWESEDELRQKADIHRARLSRYGRSKMNGEMLYQGQKGGVYKYTLKGKKKYV